MALNEQGYIGEWLSLQFSHSHKYDCFQPDWIAYDAQTNSYIVIEAKCKKFFTTIRDGCTFVGTGLPIYQINDRLHYALSTDQRCKLVVTTPENVLDAYKSNKPVLFYYAWLDELNNSQDFIDITPKNGGGDVRIFNMSLFNTEYVKIDFSKCKFNPELAFDFS